MNISLDRNLFLLTARAVKAIGFHFCVAFERKMIEQIIGIFRWMRRPIHCRSTVLHCYAYKTRPVGIIVPLVSPRSCGICFRWKNKLLFIQKSSKRKCGRWEKNQNQNHIQWNLFSREETNREKLRVNNFIFYGTFGRINKWKCFQIHCLLLCCTLWTAAFLNFARQFFLIVLWFYHRANTFSILPLTLRRLHFWGEWKIHDFYKIFIPHSKFICVAGGCGATCNTVVHVIFCVWHTHR